MEDHGQQRPDLTNGPDTDTKEGSDFVETNAEAVLDLNPTAFVDDLYNAVEVHCAAGFEELDSALRRGLAQQLTPEQLTVLLQGTAGLYQDLRADIKKRMKTFEEYSLSEILKLPPGLLANPADVQGVAGEVPHVDDEEEATVNKELFELQQDIVEMKQRARDTKTAIKTLDALIDDVKKHAGELESVPHVVGSTHVLMDDVQFVTEKGLAVERTCQKIEETLDKKDAEMKDETMLEAVSQVPKNEKELDKELYAHHSSVKEASAEDLRACRESLFTK